MTIFYSILFSLGEAKTNLYCYLPFFLYRSLTKTGSLRPGDMYVIMCDPPSADLLRKSSLAHRTNVRILESASVISMLDGMAMRYKFPFQYDCKDQTVVYLDLDLIPTKPLHFKNLNDMILVYPEGSATDSNYCGDMVLPNKFGATSGFFAYHPGPRVRNFFVRVCDNMSYGTRYPFYYTLDQPFFNKELKDLPIALMPSHMLSYNGHTNRDKAYILNMCGDPGDAHLHFLKILETYLS